mmetsp:Transcript_109722/g.164065  ORF Transcript_109722/g.164065 Transcript_109722/m.164065 type:complete len:161 (-) Transcript_109722:195-677(-)|eukprot:CAMPEP_0117013770 /NCGR_PEP_ID=MMETSP0472-20121206/11297_1 /TAXON_ID=693140 ORGANISM="Tiarina fusus, Strain LIS" /NCGR_SAMPLE_ID=MMETSP0472 /ASSEMBLY_ACC=CAM_ASM_000603 /LENGTH=160 /DNA_ID=CAMNT_0004717165 /DNA_START=100 /DNA_END=582 /DNA_ORIENTATION=+
MLTTSQKAMAFRSLSATAYLCIFLASWHAAFTGFIHFLVGIPLCVLALIMLLVQLAPVLPAPARMPLDMLEDLHFNGETVMTFGGRCMVDAILIFILCFYMKKWLLGMFTLALIGSVVALKDKEVDLFEEVFGSGGSAGGGGTAGDPSWTTGGYQTVESG